MDSNGGKINEIERIWEEDIVAETRHFSGSDLHILWKNKDSFFPRSVYLLN
jgi:hypothetical protein